MLDTTSTLALASSGLTLHGIRLTRNGFTPGYRAFLAREVRNGRASIVDYTDGQLATLFKISVSSLRRAGRDGQNRKPADSLSLAKIWDRASAQERREFVKRAGPEAVWAAITAAL